MSRSVTMYICNGKPCSRKTMYCKAHGHKNFLCAHTTDQRYAVNEACADPWNHPERFDKEYDSQINTVYFVEKEQEK